MSMNHVSRVAPATRARNAFVRGCLVSSPRSAYGRTAAYRRLADLSHSSHPSTSSSHHLRSLRSPHLETLPLATQRLVIQPTALRYLHSASRLRQDQERPQQAKDRPNADDLWNGKPSEDPAQQAAREAAQDQEAHGTSSEGDEQGSKSAGEGESEGKGEANEGKEKEDKDKPPPPPPPHGDKTPWQVFTETLQTEFKASKEWNESTKALASSAHQFTESESVKRARAAYSAASGAATSSTSTVLKGTGRAVGKGAAWTWDSTIVRGVRAGVNATGRVIEKGSRPVRETTAYKKAVGGVRDVIDDGSSSRYGGWVEKEERRKQRELREMNETQGTGRAGKRAEKLEEDPNAGTNVTVHKDAAWKESWRDFRDSSKVMQSLFTMKNTYNESENPLISTARSISDRVAGFFAENETAMVIKKFREMDPTFQIEPFLREMREYILPEVLDAYVKGDTETLKLWLSAAQYQVYAALAQQYTTAGLKSDGRILDIRHVDILSARLLEPGEVPVFIITCRTQEVHVYRNAKSNELAAGMEDKVQQVTYAIGVTRLADEVINPETRGWRLIELQKSGRDYV